MEVKALTDEQRAASLQRIGAWGAYRELQDKVRHLDRELERSARRLATVEAIPAMLRAYGKPGTSSELFNWIEKQEPEAASTFWGLFAFEGHSWEEDLDNMLAEFCQVHGGGAPMYFGVHEATESSPVVYFVEETATTTFQQQVASHGQRALRFVDAVNELAHAGSDLPLSTTAPTVQTLLRGMSSPEQFTRILAGITAVRTPQLKVVKS